MYMENRKVFFGGENRNAEGNAGHGWHDGIYSGVRRHPREYANFDRKKQVKIEK